MDTASITEITHGRAGILMRLKWRGGKIKGSVVRDNYKHMYTVIFKKGGPKKTFNWSATGRSEARAKRLAEQFRLSYNKTHNLSRNRYAFIDCPDGSRIGVAKLTQGKFLVFDPEDLHFVESRIWHASHADNDRYYVCGRDDAGKHIEYQHLLMPDANIVDHLNRNPLDNRRCNLEDTDTTGNNRNTKMHRNNTSGHNGVRRIVHGGRPYWQARYCTTVKGKWAQRTKSFRIDKLGEEVAKAAAIAFRRAHDAKYNIRNGHPV